MVSLYELRRFYSPLQLDDEDMDDKEKVARYVEHSKLYMAYLEGLIEGLQSRISKEVE